MLRRVVSLLAIAVWCFVHPLIVTAAEGEIAELESLEEEKENTREVQLVEMKDGRRIAGILSADKTRIEMLSKRSGKSIGTVVIDPADIKSIGKIAVKAVEKEPAGEGAQSEKKVIAPVGLNGRWTSYYDKARKIAQEHEVPMLIDFTGSDWCGWCIKPDEEVFADKRFKLWASNSVVLVKLDYPRKKKIRASLLKRNRALAEQYGVTGYPTVLLVNPEDETVIRKWGYYKGGFDGWAPAMCKNVPGAEALMEKYEEVKDKK